MSRVALEAQRRYVNAQPLVFTGPTGTGDGNGITYPHSKSAPALLLVKCTGATVLTVKNNGTITQGVPMPDLEISGADGEVIPVWVPYGLFATSGLVAVDTDNSDAEFAVVRDEAGYNHFDD